MGTNSFTAYNPRDEPRDVRQLGCDHGDALASRSRTPAPAMRARVTGATRPCPGGDTSGLDCNDPVTPDNVVLGGVTDFTDWAGSTGRVGKLSTNLYGAVYAYSGPNGTMVTRERRHPEQGFPT